MPCTWVPKAGSRRMFKMPTAKVTFRLLFTSSLCGIKCSYTALVALHLSSICKSAFLKIFDIIILTKF